MKESLISHYLVKLENNLSENERFGLSRTHLKRKTDELTTNFLKKKSHRSKEAISSSDVSNSSKAVNFNKRKLIKKNTLAKPFCQRFDRLNTCLKSQGAYKKCSDYSSIEKLLDKQILSKNLSIIKGFDKQKTMKKLAKLKEVGNLIFSCNRNVFLSKKKFQLKHIEPITIQLNPLKEFRFMDYVLPLDSSQLHEDNENYVSMFAGFDKIKRVLKTVDDPNKELFSIYVEDRDPKSLYSTNYCNYNELSHALDWQKSLGYIKAIDYRETLLNFMTQNTLDNNCEDLYKYNQKITLCNNDSDKNYLSNKKYYIKSIDKATKEWIKTKPFIIKENKITGHYQIKKTFKVGLNYLAVNLIKKAPDVKTDKVINMFLRWKTLNYYDYLFKCFEKQNYDWNVEGVACPDAICKNCAYEDISGQHIKTDYLNYDEKYIQNGIIYSKSTTVLVN